MSKKVTKSLEITILCPLYHKACDGCPSEVSKSYVLTEKDLSNLLQVCSTEKYESCSIFLANRKLAAA